LTSSPTTAGGGSDGRSGVAGSASMWRNQAANRPNPRITKKATQAAPSQASRPVSQSSTVDSQNWTRTAARSSSEDAKYGRERMPVIPAMRLVGNVWLVSLKDCTAAL